MDIRDRIGLKQAAKAALGNAKQEKQIAAVYVGAAIALSVVVLVIDALLDRAVSGTGGLSNLSTRAIFQLIQSAMPIVQMGLILCWDMGYLGSMLGISRGKPRDVRDLTRGFGIFFPLLRLELILGLMIGGAVFGCMYLAIWIFMFTPLSAPLMKEVSAAYSGSMLSTEVVLTDAVMDSVNQALLPILLIFLAVFALIGLPLVYRYRMANYCLLENPKRGALAALGESNRMMRGNRMNLLKLDLSLWWFYLLDGLILAVSYGDVILAELGIGLPFSAEVGFYVFYGLYFVLIFALTYFLRNYREVIYAKAYDALRPPEVPSNGVVLGNIFQM